MKALLALLLSATCVLAQQPTDLSKHVFFKHLVGTWKAEGELKGEDGRAINVTEDWKGSAGGDSTFLLEGTRTINGETKVFKWTFTHNPSTDTFDAVLTGPPEDQPLRFEAMISEVNLNVELKAITGSNSSITVKEEFTDEKRDTIASHVTFTNDEGRTTLDGTITHKKQKAP